MDKNLRSASAVIVAALTTVTISAPASAAPAASTATEMATRSTPSIAMDAFGNLSIAGMSSDEALTDAYGASPELERKLLADLNVGHCVTNQCKPPNKPEVSKA